MTPPLFEAETPAAGFGQATSRRISNRHSGLKFSLLAVSARLLKKREGLSFHPKCLFSPLFDASFFNAPNSVIKFTTHIRD